MKAVLESLDGIDESLHEHYQEQDGKFVLNLEDEPPGYVKAAQLAEAKTKLAEFRDSKNDILQRAAKLAGVDEIPEDLSPLQEVVDRYKEIDPDEYKSLKAQAGELEKKGVKGAGDIDKYLSEQLEEFRKTAVTPLQEQLRKEQEAREQAQAQADTAKLRETIRSKLNGVHESAVPFLLDQASREFHVDDGNVAAKPGRLSPRTATEWDSVDEWVEHAQKEYDFAFKGSSGGGADPKPGTGGTPGARKLVNPTPQQLGDPEIARQIREKKIEIVHQ